MYYGANIAFGLTPISFGIFLYGLAYFLVHDIFIHQRFKLLETLIINMRGGIRGAHKIP